MQNDIFLGLDIGTSGARAVAIDGDKTAVCWGSSLMQDHSPDHRDPKCWLAAARAALHQVGEQIDRTRLRAICVDGTSGTMIPIDAKGTPLSNGLMYNDPCEDPHVLDRIAHQAPATSAAHGATSGLAKVLLLQGTRDATKIVHQADWIAGALSGIYSSDDNNALKTGFDPVASCWPDWINMTGVQLDLLPEVHRPGTVLGTLRRSVALEFDFPLSTELIAGTTDGCAAFLATGASQPGDGVTSLGTTLVLKLLSDRPIFAPESGIYSHYLMGLWLAGGASNTGGGVLLDHFTPPQIAELSAQIDPDLLLNLGYYPLRHPGERFPIADPEFAPKMYPRPTRDVHFLQAMLEGIAEIESLGYHKLQALGGPAIKSIRTVGGGAHNKNWMKLRADRLGVKISVPPNTDAAYGAALLARFGMTS
ncbi:MAG: FGGY-family carbohydrate kinase [Roseobacter sp.]